MRSRVFICLATSLLVAEASFAADPAAPVHLDDFAGLPIAGLESRLAALRDSPDGRQQLFDLDTAVQVRAEARRSAGTPPLTGGCLRNDEFDLASQFRLAREAPNGARYRAAAREYVTATDKLRAALVSAERTGKWSKAFPQIKRWTRAWQKARDPRVRELLRRTVHGQALRNSLNAYNGPVIHGKVSSALAERAYDEYVFNLMCVSDEQNLAWLKRELDVIGWFDARRYGAAADLAAQLIVQHADSDPEFQWRIAALLEPKVATGDTDPQNLAYLIDRIAARAGLPQRYGTQIECVQGRFVAPTIEDRANLDARRRKMGLAPYDVQLARAGGMCRARK